ncbi:MerR family transcriptional regulator [Paenibacillus sp. YYML68]|uniref:MerR family transcriptional regulator n=1 Tax=Paenibacillus sp. YYML68 TaxID=2909250 RepID=UPI002493971A|nr:MerR family transcriptional regulator [Paenibacillus sp. YYML68]
MKQKRQRPLKVKEVAELAGISVRTLHHYDELGLLVPDQVTAAGYRLYAEESLDTLQQILVLRELDVPLKQIKQMLGDPSYDRQEALVRHYGLLQQKRDRLNRILATLETTIQHQRGECDMTNEQKFEGFDFTRNPYEAEARERWGDERVNEASEKLARYAKPGQEALQSEMNEIYRQLAQLRHGSPDSESAQEAIGRWYDCLNRIGSYSPEAFKGLGQLYVEDERFTRSIDQFGDGLARFMCEAMTVYADRASKD